MVSNSPVYPGVRHILQRLLLSNILLQTLLLVVSQAQLTLDGSLGPGGPLVGPNYRIGAELGQIRGRNLFHSFGQFNVPTGGSATFTGPDTISNIVSRVTGGQQSMIDGLLRSEILGAHFFLLNPSGVMFGPNASLDVSGSFHVSTADFLRFADGVTFSGDLGQKSVLSVASPTAFGFLKSNPAGISIQGSSLKVAEGKTLSVVGGDMTIMGNTYPLADDRRPTLSAPSGRIQLASIDSPGEVIFRPIEMTPDLRVDDFARLGRIALSQGAFLDVSGNGGGTMLIRAGNLRVDGSWLFADNLGPLDGTGLGLDLRLRADTVIQNDSLLTTDSFGAGRAKDLRLTADSLYMENAVIGSRSFHRTSGDGGNVTLNVGTLTLTSGGHVDSSTQGSGRGGTLTVTATDTISIAGLDSEGIRSGLFSTTQGPGWGGDIDVSATQLQLSDGGIISASSTQGSGRAGALRVAATEAISITGQRSGLFANSFSQGDAGRLSVSAPTLLMDGGLLATFAVGQGAAGEIAVEARRLVLTEGAFIGSFAPGSGKGGDVTVSARESVSISGRDHQGRASAIVSAGAGEPGRLSLSAPTVVIDGGVVGTPSAGIEGFIGGRGGDTIVKADTLILAGDARINSSTFTDHDGGNISIETGRLAMSGGAAILSSSFGAGRGGTVTLAATDEIAISGRDSGIFSQATGRGNAGRVLVSATRLTMDEGRLRANTIGKGDAGILDVRVGQLTLTGGAFIDSGTHGKGRGGDVTVAATDAITIIGGDREGNRSGVFSNTFGSGDGGRLFVSTPLLTMDAGLIQALAAENSSGNAGGLEVQVGRLMLTSGAQLDSSNRASGRGGTLALAATDTISIAGLDREGRPSGLFSTTLGRGRGGDIDVSATHLQLSDGGLISASSTGSGDAGTIRLRMGDTLRSENGTITTATEGAGGGAIALTAGRLVQLIDSELTTTVQGGGGDAGNITLDSPFVVLQGSQIIANAFEGMGGNIRIGAEVFLADPASQVSASSTLGIQGTVDIQAPVTSLSGALAPLPQAFVSVAELLPARCAARLSGGQASSLVLGVREGLPLDPGGLLPSPLMLDPQIGTDPAGSREPRWQESTSRFGRLEGADKGFLRLQAGASAALVPGCAP